MSVGSSIKDFGSNAVKGLLKSGANTIFLIVLAALSLIIVFPSLNIKTASLIAAIIIIGYTILRNLLYAICIGLIVGNIVVSLFKAGSIKVPIEFFENKKNGTKKDKKKKEDNSSEEEETNEEEHTEEESKDNEEEFYIDTKGSFKDNLNSLSDKEISSLNKDTKELINTQKQLLDTLSNMKPALADGKKILDSFKDYFGKDDTELSKILKNYSK